MYKWTHFILLIGLFALSGCMNAGEYHNEDVAAVVREEEMTVGSLRMLYPDEVLDDMMEEAIQAKLAEQEVKMMDIDISNEAKEIEESYDDYPEAANQTPQAASIREFAKAQGEKLNMDAKEFYGKYTKMSAKMRAYTTTYVNQILGEPEEDEADLEDYHFHANEVLENLVERNEDGIEVRINR